MNNFTPTIIEDNETSAYATMLVQVEKCPLCGCWMLEKPKRIWDTFPKYCMLGFDRQLKNADWREMTFATGEHQHICKQCSEEGKAVFTCALCKTNKPTSEIQATFGDPAEFLCKSCYVTVPASVWDENIKRLEDEHKYDFS